MNDSDVVCQCNMICVKDVSDFMQTYPALSEDQLKKIMNIGGRCGACNIPNSPNIDISYAEVVKKLKK